MSAPANGIGSVSPRSRENMETTGGESLGWKELTPHLVSRVELLERHEAEAYAEQQWLHCMGSHVVRSTPGRACPHCGGTLMTVYQADHFAAVLGYYLRRRSAQ